MEGLTPQQAKNLAIVKSTIGNLIEMRFPEMMYNGLSDFDSIERTTVLGGVLTGMRGGKFSRRRKLRIQISVAASSPGAPLCVQPLFQSNMIVGPESAEFILARGKPTQDVFNPDFYDFGQGYPLPGHNPEALGAEIFNDLKDCFIPLFFWWDARHGPSTIPQPGTTQRCDGCPEQLTCLAKRGPKKE